MNDRDDFIANITQDVLKVLAGKRFFETLDAQLCPVETSALRVVCDGTYAVSTAILSRLGFELQDTEEILQVLKSRGGCCDCEILFNVAEESRLKAEYWLRRAAGSDSEERSIGHKS